MDGPPLVRGRHVPLLVLGIRVSAGVDTALVFLKCGTLVLFVVWILFWASGAPTVAPITGHADSWRTVAGLAIFSYLGFEAVSTLGLECRNPRRDLPVGVLGSLAITTLLYLAVIAACSLVPAPAGEALLGAALATGAGPIAQLINLCVYLGFSTVLLIMMMGQSRIFFAMASDGLLPAHLLKTHPRTQAPVAAIRLTGALVFSTACLLVPAHTLYGLAVAGTLFAFTAVAVAVAVIRFREPLRPRAFRVPMIWLIAPAAIIVNLFLVSNILPGVAIEFAICAAAACFLWLFARKGFTL